MQYPRGNQTSQMMMIRDNIFFDCNTKHKYLIIVSSEFLKLMDAFHCALQL
jgi:hypothetical protein